MCARVALFIFLSFTSIQVLSAQKGSGKLSKKERKTERYFQLKEALADTSFLFVTREILSLSTGSSWSGGYLSIIGNTLRIQELDWEDNFGKKVRLREGTTLQDLQINTDDTTEAIIVQFNAAFNGHSYSFTITQGIESKSILELKKESGERVRYSGQFKWRSKRK